MKLTLIISLLGLTILPGCSDRQPKKDEVKNNDNSKHSNHFQISAIEGKLPLRLDELNLEDKNNTIHLNDGIVSKIEGVVKEYARNFEFYDSSQTYKDTYINTIQLQDSLQTIYLVLLKHYWKIRSMRPLFSGLN